MVRKKQLETEEIELLEKAFKARPELTVKEEDLVSTGLTLLNLASTGTVKGGFAKGKYYYLVGDSGSGKTFLCLTCFAEASINTQFDGYRFIFDNAEDGALMDLTHFFGRKANDRIEPPAWDGDAPIFSDTVERFYYHLDNAFDKGEPFIYILDSMDALDTDADDAHFKESKKADEKGKDKPGNYGMSKAKQNSALLRRAVSRLKKTGSILIIISQTRDNIDPMSFEKKTRAGGHSLRFYATMEMWSSVKGLLTKDVKGKRRDIGATFRIKMKKNRHTGKRPTVDVNFFHSTGVDDTSSCIDYLLEEKHWPVSQGIINAKEFNEKAKKERLIAIIQANNLEAKLARIVGKVWREIEEGCTIDRKRKYK